MLQYPAPFPLVGAYALATIDGRTRLVRIQQRWAAGDDQMALISIHGTTTASGSRTVPLADLAGAIPLTAEERAEEDALFSRRASRGTLPGKLQARFAELRRRALDCITIERLLRQAGLAAVAA